jgi:class 3 adenylate cyclase/streptogramin lyase
LPTTATCGSARGKALATPASLYDTPPMPRGRGSALVTVLFTDIVGSTEIASELGNRRWRELLGRHHRIVRRELRRFDGREVDTAGDGFFATFDRPAQGIRCAWAVTEAVRALGIEVRAGLHTGEAELMGKQVGGVAVHVGARIGAQAGPGEVLVSGTLRDLVSGTGLQFEDRGWRDLKGVAEPQRLFAVEAVDGEPRGPRLPDREAARRRAKIVPPTPLKRRGVLVGGILFLVLAVVAAVILAREDDRMRPSPVTAENAVIKVDAKGGTVGKPIPLPLDARLATFHATDLQIGEGGVWVAAGRCLCRVDPATGELRRVFSRSLALSFDRMALGLRAVWLSGVTGTGRPKLIGIDPVSFETDVESDPLDAENVFGSSVSTADGSVWLAFRGQLVEFDPHTGDPRDEVPLDVTIDGLVSTGRDLWIIDELEQTLFLFDPVSGRIQQSVELSGAPDEVAIEPDGTLWILDELGGTLTRVDPTGEADAPVSVGSRSVDVAVGGGDLWVAYADEGSVKQIDPLTLETRRAVDLPGEPAVLGVDPRTGDVWVYLS